MTVKRKPKPGSARSTIVSAVLRLRAAPQLGRILGAAVIGLGGAWLAFALAASGVTRQRAPERALFFVPWDSVALAANADLALLSKKKPRPEMLERAGRAALRNQAVNVRALRLLSIAAELRRDTVRSEQLIKLAQRVSRRDMVTQFWLIDEAIRKNNIPKVLSHYDIALRTNSTASQILFPRLQIAIGNADIRKALIPYLQSEVQWGVEFLDFAKTSGSNLPSLVSLIVENGGLGKSDRERRLQLDLIDALFAQQKYDDVRRLYLSGAGNNSGRLTSAALAPEDRLQLLSAVGWQVLNDADAGGSVAADQSTSRPILALYANAQTTRTVARKLLFLPPGVYDFKAVIAAISRGEGQSLSWQLRCVDPAATGVLWTLKNIVRSTTATVTIASGCTAQLLEISASGGSGQVGLDATIRDVSLTRN